MHAIAVVLLFLVFQSTSSGHQQKAQPEKQTAESQRTSEPPSPVTVNVTQLPPEPHQHGSHTHTDNGPIWSNWALVIVAALTAAAGIRTLRAIQSQVEEMRNTGKQTEKLIQENIAQSESLAKSVEETARFASAMEQVALSLEITARSSTDAAKSSAESLLGLRKQMRAYLTVIIGGGVAQSRENNLRFDARPTLLNGGLTPARNVRSRSKAAILPNPLPKDWDDSITAEGEEGGNFIGAHQNAQMIAVAEDFVPDDRVESIKLGNGPSVYVWGIVTYEDIFGDSHTTKFCHRLTWLADGNVFGYYIAGHNDAD
jgi:hypothetical protein